MRRPLAFLAVLIFIFVVPEVAVAKDRQTRAAACFKLLKAQAYGGQYKEGWRGSCGSEDIEREARSYAGGRSPEFDVTPERIQRHKFIASGAACNAPLGHSPVATNADCGMGGNFIDTFAKGIIRIPLPGGRCAHVVPILLTEKTGGYRCNALRARIACLQSVRQEDSQTVVALSTSRASQAIANEISIRPNQLPEQPLFAHSRGRPMFALIPADFMNYNENRNTIPFIAGLVDQIEARCLKARGKSGMAHCRLQSAFHAERLIQEQLRRAWAPRAMISGNDKRIDAKQFMDKARGSALQGAAAADKRVLFETIVANEIGNSSPYQLLDAVADNSGPSWGAHQIDIGANDQSEINLLWRILMDNGISGDKPNLSLAAKFKECISAPVRHYYLEPLSVYYRSVPAINRALRSEGGRSAYDDRFKAWLTEETGKALKLTGLFPKSMFARIFYLDVLNQYGKRGADALKKNGQNIRRVDLGDCENIRDAENDLIKTLIEARTDKKGDIERRSKHIRNYIEINFPETKGRTDCR